MTDSNGPIDLLTFEALLDMRRDLEAKLGPAPPEVVEVDGLEPGVTLRVDMPNLFAPVVQIGAPSIDLGFGIKSAGWPEKRETRPVLFVGRSR